MLTTAMDNIDFTVLQEYKEIITTKNL